MRIVMSLPSNRPRKRVIAAVLAIVAVPLAMLYVGRPLRAAVYLAATVFAAVAAHLVAAGGLWPAGLSWVFVSYAVTVVGLCDAWRIAGRLRGRFHGSWYTRWSGIGGVAVLAGVAVLLFRAVAFEPFRTPASAMAPTLEQGDLFFVSKSAYGLRVPFTTRTVAFERQPARGDVVVFRAAGTNYLKRVIGLPGDVVGYGAADKRVTINGELIAAELLRSAGGESGADVMLEQLDGREYTVQWLRGRQSPGGTYRVPQGHYFVLGDNRDNSRDSRFPGIGFVPREAILGRAALIWWNTAEPGRAGTVL